ncbi:MAG TPA: hypothetical protein DCY12_07825 [Candidatus Atribacteria bacterium]|nr:hypothetical protein [Candidatus Atribacteria bacterium]HCU21617.1 hypothetical protein [Candidatus Atribacteria bacterium]
MASISFTPENQINLYSLFFYILLISLPLLILILINHRIRKINKEINQLSQEIIKVSSKKVDKFEKADNKKQ